MQFIKFWMFNVLGAVLWVSLFLLAGYFLAKVEWIQKNFFLVTIAIILVSVLPILWEWWQARRSAGTEADGKGL
jgi:membrane-associated protein